MPTTVTPQVRFRTVDGARIRYAGSGGPQIHVSRRPREGQTPS